MKKVIFVAVLIVGCLSLGYAQSNVTLTSFYNAYSQLENVQTVLQMGVLDGNSAYFLMDENNPIDQKAAVINALIESDKEQENATTFSMFVARKYGVNFQDLDLNLLTGDELFCMGYLTIIDEQGNPNLALPILEKAIEKDSKSYTIQLITALAKAQSSLNQKDNCTAWKTFSTVASSASLTNDLNSAIKNDLNNAMNPFKQGCE
jgi:hypothetical protein